MEQSISLVVGFAFATPPTAQANEWLRQHIHGMQGVDYIYTQPDLAQGLKGNVEVIPENQGEPSPTLRIARGAIKFAQKIGATKIEIVATGPHKWRCIRDLKMALHEAGVDISVIAEDIPGLSWGDWFHHSSTQPRTRSPWAWLRRDVLLRLMPFWLYKRVAS